MARSLNKTLSTLNRAGFEVVIRFTPDEIAAIIIKKGENIVAQGFSPSTNRKLAAKVDTLGKAAIDSSTAPLDADAAKEWEEATR
jgi:hypothetical protein